MEILARALERLRANTRLALVTVVRASGSTPRHAGARMLVDAEGRTEGTIGGGRVELEVTREATGVAAGEPARLVTHHLVRDLAMCCGGSMELYLEPVAPSRDAIARALSAREARRPCVLVTPLGGGPKYVEEEAPAGGRPVREASRFLEPILPTDRLVLFGAGHVGSAIGPLAADVGFDVTVCDDGDTGALGEVPAWAARAVESFEIADLERELGPLGAGDYAVIATRDHAVDQRIVERLLPNESLAYLGLIGSRGKVERFRRRLEAKGIATAPRWARLRAPIGLDIGAETPAEIAVSVVAELIATRRARAE